jgi:hypothetical protein
MLVKASRDLKHAAALDTVAWDEETQRFLKSALHNITAAVARFESDVLR